EQRALEMVRYSLGRMAAGGIYDHLGGGFARYSTDERWLVPHFEKMLYDNAEMVDLLTLAWQGTGERLYAERVRETIGWVLREMIALDADGRPTLAFASTLDADSEGVEGKFYVWSEEEIDRLLGTGSVPGAAVFKRAYDVSPEGNWEGTNILNRSAAPDLGEPAFEEDLARMRAVLSRARDERIRPGWDDKVLADWNGLMIAALANAGFAFDEPAWTAAAAGAFDFVAGTLGAGGRLHHGWRRGVLRHPASLDDHANMIRAALALHETTGEARFLERARAWVADLDHRYWDDDGPGRSTGAGGGYFYTADDAERLLVRVKSVADQAVPSGNGTMVAALARLYHLTGETAFRDRAEALVAAFSGELTRNFFPLATFLNGIELLQSARQIVVVGDPGDPGRHALLDVVRRTALPNRVLTILDPGASLPPGHPAHGKGPVDGRPAAYVCENATCSAPVGEPDALAARLAEPAA
ncbi:MAG TPA: thioredoxin domain-containing protein, partial [Arenibaculum sp.]|nr:thioredoxin domain-containing protein [Arenibaculum sp.]